MAAEFPSQQKPSVRGGVVVSERVYVDADGNRVAAESTAPKRLYAAPGATLSESEARRLGVTTSEDPAPSEPVVEPGPIPVKSAATDEPQEPAEQPAEPADEQFVCACGYEAKSKAGLSAHQRACEDSG